MVPPGDDGAVTADPGRYARAEWERRWLLAEAPPGLVAPRRIEDRYLDRTRLRLRQVTDGEGTVVRKLGQKVRVRPDDPSGVWLTSMYLDDDEYVALVALPGREMVKTRSDWPAGGCVVDVFEGPLAGLVVAEAERPDAESLLDAPAPPDAGREVTGDDRFSGGRLAALDAAGLAELLA